ncbi:Cell division protein FtsN [compost metagenome]
MLIRALITFLSFLWLAGCGPSNEKVAELVKSSMQETLSTDENYKEYNLNVQSVAVIHEADNRYQGLATIEYEGEPYKVAISITADSDNAMWKSEPGTFVFIAQHKIKKLQSLFKQGGEEQPKTSSVNVEQQPQYSTNLSWSVQIASLSNRDTANKLVSDLEKYGYKVYIRQTEGMNRVFVGPVDDRNKANRLRDQLSRQNKLNGFVVRFEPE